MKLGNSSDALCLPGCAVLCQPAIGCSGVMVGPYIYSFRDSPEGKIGKVLFGETHISAMKMT